MSNIIKSILPDENMKVVGHEAVGEQLYFVGVVFDWLGEWSCLPGVSRKVGVGQVEVEIAEECLVICFVLKDDSFLDTSIVDVVVRTRLVIFDTMF